MPEEDLASSWREPLKPGDRVGRYEIRRRDRPGRVRRGLRGLRHGTRTHGRAQGPEAGAQPAPALRGVDPEGSRGGREARPPGHRHHPRRRDLPGGCLPRDGVAPRRDAGEAHREGSPARRRGAADRRADGGGARARPFTRRAAPGPEARERLRLRGRPGEAARLRARAPARDRGVERRRDSRVHGAGAGGGGGRSTSGPTSGRRGWCWARCSPGSGRWRGRRRPRRGLRSPRTRRRSSMWELAGNRLAAGHRVEVAARGSPPARGEGAGRFAFRGSGEETEGRRLLARGASIRSPADGAASPLPDGSRILAGPGFVAAGPRRCRPSPPGASGSARFPAGAPPSPSPTSPTRPATRTSTGFPASSPPRSSRAPGSASSPAAACSTS